MKFWNLKKGDILSLEDQEYTFIKMDGMYAQWIDLEGNFVIFGMKLDLIKIGDKYFVKQTTDENTSTGHSD